MFWPRQWSWRVPPSSAKAGHGTRNGSTVNLSTNMAITLPSRWVSRWQGPACRCRLLCWSRTLTLGEIPPSIPKRRWTRSTEIYPYATFATRNLVMSSIGPDGFPEVAEETPGASNGSGARFLYWPIIVALGWLVALVLTGTVPDPWGFIGLLAILVLWPLSALCACIAALVRVYRREWRRSTSM